MNNVLIVIAKPVDINIKNDCLCIQAPIYENIFHNIIIYSIAAYIITKREKRKVSNIFCYFIKMVHLNIPSYGNNKNPLLLFN